MSLLLVQEKYTAAFILEKDSNYVKERLKN